MTSLEPLRQAGVPSRPHRPFRLFVVLGLLMVAIAGSVAFAVSGSSPGVGHHSAGKDHGTVAPGAHGPDGVNDGAATAPSSLPALGVYTGPGASAAAEAVNEQLGGKVQYALDFLPQTSWAAMTDPSWLQGAWADSPFDLVIGVPMLPKSSGTMAAGAAGDYDAQFSLLAQRLVAANLGGAVLMVGWQPDDSGRPWYVATTAEAQDYVKYWDAIESAMAAVPGAHFVFEWDPGDSDGSPVSPALMYPGGDAVGMVATDAFDLGAAGSPADEQWPTVLDREYGPAWMASFAAEHDKPLALAMWGVAPVAAGGGGDAPTYVGQLLHWGTAVGAKMCVLWDYGTWALTGGDFPSAAARLNEVVQAAEVRPAGG